MKKNHIIKTILAICITLLTQVEYTYSKSSTADADFLRKIAQSKVTIKVQNASLKSILYQIQEQTNINFVYTNANIKDFPAKTSPLNASFN